MMMTASYACNLGFIFIESFYCICWYRNGTGIPLNISEAMSHWLQITSYGEQLYAKKKNLYYEN